MSLVAMTSKETLCDVSVRKEACKCDRTEHEYNLTLPCDVTKHHLCFVIFLDGQPCGGTCILCVKMLTLRHMHVRARMYAHVHTARCMLEGLPRAAKIKELYWRQMMRNMASSGKYSDQTAVSPH